MEQEAAVAVVIPARLDSRATRLVHVLGVLYPSWTVTVAGARGKGYATAQALATTRGDVVVTMDADYPHPELVGAYVAWFQRSGLDVAFTRRCYARPPPLRRRVATTVFRGLRWLLFGGMPDTQSGVKLFRGSVARCVGRRTRERGFVWDVELCLHVRRCGVRVGELPIPDVFGVGSRVRVVGDGARMGVRLVWLWLVFAWRTGGTSL